MSRAINFKVICGNGNIRRKGQNPASIFCSKSMRNFIFLCAVVFVLSPLFLGCSRLNCTRLEEFLGADVNLVSLGKDIGDTLIAQSFPPLLPRQPNQPVFISTPVNNDNLTDSSSFGRSLQNAITAEFVRQGFAVNEIKLRGNVVINAGEGEFMLSRDLMELKEKQRAQAVVVGTYTLSNRIMYLSIRLVKPGTGAIFSVYEKRICLDANSLQMLGLQLSEEDGVAAPGEPWLDKLLYW
jgi:TolB-like protein